MTESNTPSWLENDDPRTLVRRVERVMAVLDRETDPGCVDCDKRVCGHEVLFSLAAGHQDAPLCLGCLADDVGRTVDDVRDGLLRFVLSKECLRRGWHLSGLREGTPESALPACLWPADVRAVTTPAPALVTPETDTEQEQPPRPTATWDAGELGCGELVLELRLRLRSLEPGAVLLLTALDPGAPEDIPAWCRLTGNHLISQTHPRYWIRRKD